MFSVKKQIQRGHLRCALKTGDRKHEKCLWTTTVVGSTSTSKKYTSQVQ